MTYNPREDDKVYIGTQLLDNIENGVIGSMEWLQNQAKDDPDRYTDDMLRLLGGGVKNVGWALSKVPFLDKIAQGEDWLAGKAREMSAELTPQLDPRFAGWGTRFGTGILADKGIRKATGAVTKGVRAYQAVSKADEIMAAAKARDVGLQMMEQIDNPKAPIKIFRSDATKINQALVNELRSMHGGTKEQAAGFLATQRQGLKDIRAVIRFLNVKALQQEPKNLLDFAEAIEVALGRKVDPKDFVGKGKSITYKSAKGKQIIKDLDSLEKALFDRLTVVGSRGKGHFSLGHIRAVQNLIEQGDIGANRVTNMEPEVLRSILKLTDASSDQIEELREILGNSARKHHFDKPDQILTAQGVSRTINEEYLKYIEPKLLGNYWSEVLPSSHHEWFADSVEAAVSKKVKWARKLKKVKTVEEGNVILRKIRQEVMEDYLNVSRPFGDAFEKLRESGLDAIIMREAPEIIVNHLEVIKDKVVWIPPTKGPDFNKLQRLLQRGDDMTFPPGMGLE